MKKLFLVMSVVSLISASGALTFGAAPGFIDLGNVDRGSTENFNIYVTTDAQNSFQLSPQATYPFPSTMFDRTDLSIDQVSEQEVAEWFVFPEGDAQVDDLSESMYTLPDGSKVSAVASVPVKLRVPDRAEPGYHFARIELNPEMDNDGSGFGTQTRGVSIPQVLFRVPGNADRDISVNDITAVRTAESRVQIVLTIRNSGTVSTSLENSRVNITESGRNVASVALNTASPIAPGETVRVDANWVSNDVEGGNYRVEGDIGYHSASIPVIESISVTDSPKPAIVTDDDQQQDQQQENEEQSAPLLLIFGVVIGLGSLLYVMGLDIVWVTLISGLAGIAIFIITAGLPIYILIAGILGAGFLLYMEM